MFASRLPHNQLPFGKQISLYIPTFLNDQQSFKQGKTGQDRQNATCGTHLAISNLVSNSLKHVNRETNTFTTVPVSAHESTETVTPTSDKQNLKISGVDSLREKLLIGSPFRDSFPTYFEYATTRFSIKFQFVLGTVG